MAKKKPSTKKKPVAKPVKKDAAKPSAKPAAKPSAKKVAKAPAAKPTGKKAPSPAKKPAPAKATKTPKAAKPKPAPAAKAPKTAAGKPAAPAKAPVSKKPAKAAAPTKPSAAPKPAKAPASAKPAPVAKTPVAPKGSKTKTAPPASKPTKSAGRGKPSVPAKSDAETFAEAQAAAARLAAIAGIRPIESRPFEDPNAADDSKRLTKSPLSKKELTQYKDLLLRKRAEIMGDVVSMEDEALMAGDRMSHTPNHMAEQGSDVYGQTLSLDIAASQRKLVVEIEQALERIENGTYGVCVMMGTPIGKARLDAKPWAKYCIEAARRMERGGSLA